MVLFDHLAIDQPSLQQHSLTLYKDHGRKISKQALDKRFNEKAVAFVQKLFERYLELKLEIQKLPSKLENKFTAIRIMDSTEFKLPASLSEAFPGFQGDGTSSCTQIQFEYDILSARIQHLSIENARDPDNVFASLHINDVQPGNLVIRDLGYNTLNMLTGIEERKAYYVSRLNTQMILYEGTGKKLLSLKTIVQRLRKSKRKYLDMPILMGKESKHPVRLIANLLEPSAVEKRLNKKIYRKNSHNRKYRYLSQLNLFITNIPKETISDKEIYLLYKTRWQIELVFKTWKSVLKIDLVRKMKASRFQCYLISKLLWILMNWDICTIFNENILKTKKHMLSIYKCFAILRLQVSTLKRILTATKEGINKWLREIYLQLSEYGLKENRIGKENLINLLQLHSIY